jgi:hypothetical protein
LLSVGNVHVLYPNMPAVGLFQLRQNIPQGHLIRGKQRACIKGCTQISFAQRVISQVDAIIGSRGSNASK